MDAARVIPHCHAMVNDFDFFRNAVLQITRSLDLSVALRTTVSFLKRYFPVDAISLHQYSSEHRALKLLFLVDSANFFHVEKWAPLPPDGIKIMEKTVTELLYKTKITSCNRENAVALAHAKALRPYLSLRNCGRLIGGMGLGQDLIGNIVFLGKGPECFSPEHERLLEMLLPPFSLVMANLLQFKRTMDFQVRLDEEKNRLAAENRLLRKRALVGGKSGLRKVFEAIRQLSGRDIPVLIEGETGTGKECVADAVQEVSGRFGKPYVKVNCGAIPDSLLDSEFFGYEKGAFTGAHAARPGFFEQAGGGTLFLDEVGELSPSAQIRLLRVLQNGEIQRLGGAQTRPVDVRIIAATNRNLEQMLQRGLFREDLYYRLNVFRIRIPPLRERAMDIPLLIRHFLTASAEKLGLPSPGLDQASFGRLQLYSWPGNVRELENMVERALIMDPSRPLNLAKHLPQDEGWFLRPGDARNYLQRLVDERLEQRLAQGIGDAGGTPLQTPMPSDGDPAPLDEVVAAHIRKALVACRGKINGPGGAAEFLRLPPSTLRKRMKKLNISNNP